MGNLDDATNALAFDLLSSSTIGRYARCAASSEFASSIRADISRDPESLSEYLRVARNLWQSLLSSKTRGLPEVRLVAIIAAIAQNQHLEVLELLDDIGRIDRPSVAWVAAFARRLLGTRRTNRVVNTSSDAFVIWFVAESPGDRWLDVPTDLGIRSVLIDAEGPEDSDKNSETFQVSTDGNQCLFAIC